MLLNFLFISPYIQRRLSLYIAYSVRTVIDYVTVYRAHSSQQCKEEGCDTPFCAVPPYAPLLHLLQADNSVTGRYPLSVFLKSGLCSARTRNLAPRFTPWHSARSSLPSAILPMRSRGSVCASMVVARKDSGQVLELRAGFGWKVSNFHEYSRRPFQANAYLHSKRLENTRYTLRNVLP